MAARSRGRWSFRSPARSIPNRNRWKPAFNPLWQPFPLPNQTVRSSAWSTWLFCSAGATAGPGPVKSSSPTPKESCPCAAWCGELDAYTKAKRRRFFPRNTCKALRRTNWRPNWPLPEYDPDLFPPVLVDSQHFPIDLRRQITQDRVGGGMQMQGGRDQHEQRLLRRELASREIAELRKLSAALVPQDTRPVIHALQGKVEIFVGFEFDDGQSRVTSYRKNVNHRSIRRGECGNLGIHRFRPQPSVERRKAAGDERCQAALGMHSPQRMVLGTILMTHRRCQPHQIGKLRFVLQVENALLRPHAKSDFLAALEISRIVRNPRLGEFKPMPPE